MNIEVEIKIKIDNFEEIKKKVSNIGKLIKETRQIDEYYVPFHKNFFEIDPTIEFLRIRTNQDKTVFEYTRCINMKNDGKYDYAEEYETEIKNVDEFRKTLEFLDFKKIVVVDKKREYWMCGNIEVALDKVEGLGEYIEAEAKGDFKDSGEARNACIKFLKDLGIEDVEERSINLGYPQILLKNDKEKY
jgi:adenylate cyclase class 2